MSVGVGALLIKIHWLENIAGCLWWIKCFVHDFPIFLLTVK